MSRIDQHANSVKRENLGKYGLTGNRVYEQEPRILTHRIYIVKFCIWNNFSKPACILFLHFKNFQEINDLRSRVNLTRDRRSLISGNFLKCKFEFNTRKKYTHRFTKYYFVCKFILSRFYESNIHGSFSYTLLPANPYFPRFSRLTLFACWSSPNKM